MTLPGQDEAKQDGSIEPAGLVEEIVEGLPVGVTIQSFDGASLYANSAARNQGADRVRESNVDASAASMDRLPPNETEKIRRFRTQLGDRTIEIARRAVELRGSRYIVATSSDVTEQTQLEDDLFRRAYFDELTNLPNGAFLEKGVQSLIEGSSDATKFALAFIDVDNFKHIQDYFGGVAAEELLVKIARRISDMIRLSDVLARVGANHFALLLSPIGEIDELNGDIHRLSARLKEPFFIDGYETFSSASIGISLFPRDGRDYETLRLNAGGAMNPTRGGAKGAVTFFDTGLAHKAAHRAKLEQRMRLAIRDRQLCCAFQPKVNFRSHSIVGLEVLLRWRDEEGLIHAPGDFVNLAVELGLMDEITRLVLAQAVEAIDRIDDAFGRQATISVNIAAKQATDFTFMQSFVAALKATQYPERFIVELTEEAFFHKSLFQGRILPLLRDIGAKISIDDFGAGFSSLSALAEISADEIKVDRSFIIAIHQRRRSQAVLKAIEFLGSELGMSVLVEGVETAEELAYIAAATKIELAQGYYFAKPMFFDEIPRDKASAYALRETGGAREAAAARAPLHRALRRVDGRIG
jgi:diguanylate cyclase (GGDEF)-like protein